MFLFTFLFNIDQDVYKDRYFAIRHVKVNTCFMKAAVISARASFADAGTQGRHAHKRRAGKPRTGQQMGKLEISPQLIVEDVVCVCVCVCSHLKVVHLCFIDINCSQLLCLEANAADWSPAGSTSVSNSP